MTTSRSNPSLSQSWGEVERGKVFSEVNPCNLYNPFDILVEEGLVNDPVGSDNMNTASISHSELNVMSVRLMKPLGTVLIERLIFEGLVERER